MVTLQTKREPALGKASLKRQECKRMVRWFIDKQSEKLASYFHIILYNFDIYLRLLEFTRGISELHSRKTAAGTFIFYQYPVISRFSLS